MQEQLKKNMKHGNFVPNVNRAVKMSTDFQKFMKDFSDNKDQQIFDYSDFANNPILTDHNRRLK